jgi:hypothetical protein
MENDWVLLSEDQSPESETTVELEPPSNSASTIRSESLAQISPKEEEKQPKVQNNSNLELKLLTYNFFMRPPGIRNNATDFKVRALLFFSSSFHNIESF